MLLAEFHESTKHGRYFDMFHNRSRSHTQQTTQTQWKLSTLYNNMSLDKTNESQSVEHKNVKPQARSNLGDKARTDETTLFRNLETVNSNITVPYPVETGLLCCDHACWLW